MTQEFNNESHPDARVAEAETALQNMLRWVDLSMETAKCCGFSGDKDLLREQLLLNVTEGGWEDQHVEALRTVEEVNGWVERQEWEKQFVLPSSPWAEAKRQLDANPAPSIAGGFC